MPLYLKSPTRAGEYVFDHAWADAYERAGGAYYPKLQSCAPFSPVTGPRLIVRPDVERPEAQRRLLAGRRGPVRAARRRPAVNVTFPTEAEWDFMGEQGLLQRQDQQYHWHNRRLRDLRRLPGRPVLRPAQDHPARAARRPGRRSRSSP